MTTEGRHANRIKIVLAAAAACGVFSAVNAFAASLGSGTQGLGATGEVVAACGSGMTLAYTTVFQHRVGGYAVDGVDVSNIPAGCLGKNLTVTFTGDGENAVGAAVSATLPASDTTQVISIAPSSNLIDAGQVSGVSVVVS